MLNRIVVGAGYGLGLVDPACHRHHHGGLYPILLVTIGAMAPEQLRSVARHLRRWLHAVHDLPVLRRACSTTWIGVRDIWMDYVKPDGLRLVFEIATAAALVGYAGWAAKILWRL